MGTKRERGIASPLSCSTPDPCLKLTNLPQIPVKSGHRALKPLCVTRQQQTSPKQPLFYKAPLETVAEVEKGQILFNFINNPAHLETFLRFRPRPHGNSRRSCARKCLDMWNGVVVKYN